MQQHHVLHLQRCKLMSAKRMASGTSAPALKQGCIILHLHFE